MINKHNVLTRSKTRFHNGFPHAFMPEKIKSQRLYILDKLLNDIQREFNDACIGQDMVCMLDGRDKTGHHWVYRTPYMQPCIVDTETAPTLAQIHVTDANKASLRGKII